MTRLLFRAALILQIAGALLFLGILAYLGTYARPMSDDYCESVMTRASSPAQAVIDRYMAGKWRAANRYSNLLFAGILDSFGEINFRFAPPLMIALWLAGLLWLGWELRAAFAPGWEKLAWLTLVSWLAFFSALIAANRFQVFYWRSGMATHFAPLVFLTFLAAGFFHLTRTPRRAAWWSVPFFLSSFMIAGFSEPPNTAMNAALILALAYTLLFIKDSTRRAKLALIISMLTGSLLSLGVMAASPAVSALRVSSASPNLTQWVYRFSEYTFLFVINSFRALPLPLAVSFLSAAALMFTLQSQRAPISARLLWKAALAAPLLVLLLIAAGFSASAYGQSYPVARSRFFAEMLFAALLIFEGGLTGIWLSRFGRAIPVLELSAAMLLLLLAIYPIRAAAQLWDETLPAYQTRAADWDAREALIYNLKAQGKTDLTIYQMDGVNSTKELDTYATHWTNQCAAQYYGVESIRAIPRK